MDPTQKAATLAKLHAWEVLELEWVDIQDFHIQQHQDSAPVSNVQLSSQDKQDKFNLLLMETERQAEGIYDNLRLMNNNLASQLARHTLETLRNQTISAEAAMDQLWANYEELMLLKPGQLRALSAEYFNAKRKVKNMAALLLSNLINCDTDADQNLIFFANPHSLTQNPGSRVVPAPDEDYDPFSIDEDWDHSQPRENRRQTALEKWPQLDMYLRVCLKKLMVPRARSRPNINRNSANLKDFHKARKEDEDAMDRVNVILPKLFMKLCVNMGHQVQGPDDNHDGEQANHDALEDDNDRETTDHGIYISSYPHALKIHSSGVVMVRSKSGHFDGFAISVTNTMSKRRNNKVMIKIQEPSGGLRQTGSRTPSMIFWVCPPTPPPVPWTSRTTQGTMRMTQGTTICQDPTSCLKTQSSSSNPPKMVILPMRWEQNRTCQQTKLLWILQLPLELLITSTGKNPLSLHSHNNSSNPRLLPLLWPPLSSGSPTLT